MTTRGVGQRRSLCRCPCPPRGSGTTSKRGLLMSRSPSSRIRTTRRLLAMTSRRTFAIPRHDMSGLCVNVSRHEQSGRGECRVPAAPAASHATKKSMRVSRYRFTGTPGIPCAMVLTAASCSPRRSGFLVTVIGEISFTNLTPASRRQDHTTSPSASQAHLVKSAARVHRIPSRVRDDRDTPLHGDGTAADVEVIWVKREVGIFLRTGLDR